MQHRDNLLGAARIGKRIGNDTREVTWEEEPQDDYNECNPGTNLSPAILMFDDHKFDSNICI